MARVLFGKGQTNVNKCVIACPGASPQSTAYVATTDLVMGSSILEVPDLMLATPFIPEGNRSTIGSVTMVGQVNGCIGARDGDTVIQW